MATLSNVTFRIENVVLSFPHLFEKATYEGIANATPAYSAEFIVNPTTNPAAFAAMQEAFRKCATDAGKAEQLSFLTPPWRTGEDVNAQRQRKGKEPRAELNGCVLVKGKDANYAPTVVDRTGLRPIKPEQRDQIFGGCIVNAVLSFYYTNNPVNPGVYCSLVGVQLVDNVNVTPLGGSGPSRRPEDLFNALPPLQDAPTGGPKQEKEGVPWM